MPFLDHFCFCCSVRLGAIFSGIYSTICSATCLYFLGVFSAEYIQGQMERYEVLKQVEDNSVVHRIVYVIHANLALFLEACIAIISLHLTSCALLIIGSISLSKYLLVPFMVLNLSKVLVFLSIHIIAMMCLKKHLPLGELIAATCAGGFYILFLLYMWTTPIALYQQIVLIHSDEYRLLYGSEISKSKAKIVPVKAKGNLLDSKAGRVQGQGNPFRPMDDDTNMLYKDFMAIYSRKRI